MKYAINPKLSRYLDSEGLDVSDTILYLLAIKHGLDYRCREETFRFLTDKSMIRMNFGLNKIEVTTGIYEDEIVDLPDIDYSLRDQINERIDEYRSMFKGIRSLSIGNKQKVIDLMTRFCLENQADFDEILEATKVFMSYTETQVIPNADNFIYKLDKDGNEISLLKLAMEEQSMSNTSDNRTYKVI